MLAAVGVRLQTHSDEKGFVSCAATMHDSGWELKTQFAKDAARNTSLWLQLKLNVTTGMPCIRFGNTNAVGAGECLPFSE